MRSPVSMVGIALAVLLLACGSGSPPAPQSQTGDATLTARVDGPGRMEITSARGVEECLQECVLALPMGDSVTIAAVPDGGASFTGWSGACSGTGGCSLAIAASVEVVAAFGAATEPPPEPPPPPPPQTDVTLAVALAGDGAGTVTSDPSGIDCGATCTATMPAGTNLALSAAAAAGSTFAGWGGACSGTGTCRLTLSGTTVSVTAQFVRESVPGWRVTELVHPDGHVVAVDLNARGEVLGSLLAADSTIRPVLFDPAGAATILPFDLRPIALGDTGVIAFVANDGSRAFRYEGGALVEIGAGVQPVDVGPQGWIVGSVQAADGRSHGFVEDGSELRVLGVLPPDDQSFARAVNGDGIVVGTSDQRAVRLTAERAVDLGVPPVAAARDVGESGLVVGSAGRTGTWPPQAFVKDLATGEVRLVDPPAGHAGVTFERVNAAGTVIASVHAGPDERPMLWSSGRYQRLADLVPDLGWTITDAPEINDRGQVLVVGHGTDSMPRAAILTPPASP